MFNKRIKKSVLAILCAAAMAASTGCATNAGNTQNQNAEAAVEGQSTGGPAEDQSATAAPEGQNADQNADQNQTAWNAFTDVPDDDSDEWKKTSLPKEETYYEHEVPVFDGELTQGSAPCRLYGDRGLF